MKKIIVLLLMGLIIIGFVLFIKKDKEIEKIYMIDLSNYDVNSIEKYALENNLKLNIKEIHDINIEKGKFISQSIKEGQEIKKDDNLEITFSLGIDKKIYEEYKVNELGNIPVMMYHGIRNMKNEETEYIGGNIDYDGYQRTSEAFRQDLEFYYENGYRMIRLADYIEGNIDVELGKSPVILTFDDGLSNNIKVLGLDENGDIIIDPNSAVGILESFKEKYKDYNVTATFFVNGGIFNQSEYNEKILNWLIDNGYDIGNHSYTHANISKISTEETKKEIGKMYQTLDKYIKDKYVNIVALPFGEPGRKNDNYQYILKGKYNDYEYETVSTLRVAWEADYSPFNKNFDKTYIKRIRAYDNNGKDFDIEYNFNVLKKNRYISDGNKDIVVIKEKDENNIDTSKRVISY